MTKIVISMNTSYKIIKIKPGFTIYRFIGLILGLLIFYTINEIGGLLLLFISGVFALTTSGKEIDFASRKIRNYTSLGNLTFGSWDNLPKIEYIAVVRMIKGKKKFHASSVSVVQEPSTDYLYHLNFVVNPHKQETYKICNYDEGEQALKHALELGKSMNLKVLDFTTPNHKWIN